METINLYNPQNMEVTLTDVAQAARQAANDLVILDDRLLTLRLSFGKLRSAIENAFAPVTASLAPMLNSAIRALTDLGMRVPEDISVVGFDGLVLGDYTVPRLTTVAQPTQDLVNRALALLAHYGIENAQAIHEIVPVALQVKESTRKL